MIWLLVAVSSYAQKSYGRATMRTKFLAMTAVVTSGRNRNGLLCSRWGYFNFNHHEPKAPTAKVTECGHVCHLGGAKKDEVWTQFYPLLDK